MVTKAELQEMTKSGRTAIEYRMLEVLFRPKALTEADHKEMEALRALMENYDDLMTICLEKPEAPEASNDANGGKE